MPSGTGVQPPDHISFSTPALVLLFILAVVAMAAYRDPKLATAIGTACAVGALMIVVLAV